MIICLSACQNDGTGQPGDQPNNENILHPFAFHPETVTISVARQLNLGNPLAEGVTTSDNIYIDVIKEKLNVQVIIDWETIPQDYSRRLALAIANDTLPDVFVLEMREFPVFQWLVENGKLADLTDAYNHAIGGYDALYLSMLDGSQNEMFIVDGRLMAIPAIPTGYNFNVLWVRQDWLDKLNLPVPRTTDEIRDTALAFIRNNLGGPNTQGIVINPDPILGSSGSFLTLSTVAHASGAYPTEWILDSDGKVTYGSIMPEMYDALAVLKDWYQAGVLDPRFMSYPDMDAVTPAIRDGRCGMFFGAYWSPYIVGYSTEDHETLWTPVIAPLDESGIFNHTNNRSSGSFLVVSSNVQCEIAAIQAINVAFELQRGAYNNNPEIKAEVDRLLAAGSFGRTINPFPGSLSGMFDEEARRGVSYMQFLETGVLDYIPGLPIESIKEHADKILAWYNSDRIARTDTELENRILYESYKTIASIYQYENRHEQPIAFNGFTSSMTEYWPALWELERQAIIQIVSGEKMLDHFFEFAFRWRNMGGDIIIEEIQAILDS